MFIEKGPQEELPEDESQESFSQEGGENVVFDKTSADERMEELEKQSKESDENLFKMYEDQPALLAQLRRDLHHIDTPQQKEASRELLFRNISAAFKETMEESQTMLEMNPGSLFSIFSKADEKQVEYWMLQILAGYQDVDKKEQDRRVLALRGLRTLVKESHFTSLAQKYLPELKIELDERAPSKSSHPQVPQKQGSWWKRFWGNK